MTETDGSASPDLILVVDDDEMQRLVAREFLESAGFTVAEAEDGPTGFAQARTLRPALILLDVMMPGIDGFEVCRRIRADAEIGNLPVLITTGLDDWDAIERGFEAGATDFLTKPVNWPLFRHRMRFMLRASRIDSELREAKDQAESANRAKAAFLAAMSHELRTPLNAIIGFSEVIKDEILGASAKPEYTEYARHIHSSGGQLLDIINDILDMARFEAGEMTLREDEFPLSDLIAQVVEQFAGRAAAAGVSVECTLPDDLPGVAGDQARLRQALSNLISNAVKFNRDGGHVRVRAAADDEGGLRIEVDDDGIGIDPDVVPRIMEPFRQADERLSRTHEGVGLGLPLAVAIARRHGGRVEIDTAPGRGTCATLVIPPARVLADTRRAA
ncbi:MAG: hybrid sensor histidine kinase/response regulator [Rhodospirillales bacterium]